MCLDAAKASRFGEEDSRLNFDVLNVAIHVSKYFWKVTTGRKLRAFKLIKKVKMFALKYTSPTSNHGFDRKGPIFFCMRDFPSESMAVICGL